jgi:glycosyltransferase involved in cell wall biosynthesis
VPRVLLITKHPFVPEHDGTSAIISLWYECLRGLGFDIEVLSFDYVSESWTAQGRARLARDGARLHVVPAYGGGRTTSLRRLATVGFAALRGHRFAPEWLRTSSRARASLDAVFATPYDLIVAHGVDAVHLAGADRLRRHRAPKLLDIHDHFPFRILALQRALARIVRWQGLSAARYVSRSDVLQALAWPAPRVLTRAECARAATCDRILCSADTELDALRDGGIDAGKLVPIHWPIARPDDTGALREGVLHAFGFIGSGALFNVEGLMFFCREVWPLIRAARPDATLLVAGRAGEACARLPEHERPGIAIAGWIDDLGEFHRAVEVVVIPLLSGTGVSVKTMQAAAQGAAIVSTEAGLRGLALRDGIEVSRADSAADFARASLDLLGNRALAARLGNAARAAMAASHDPAAFQRRVEEIVAELLPGGPVEARGPARAAK